LLDRGTKPLLERRQRRSNQPRDLPERRRLQPQHPTLRQHRVPQRLPPLLTRAHLGRQPVGQLPLVSLRTLPEPQRGADLFNRPPGPLVVGEQPRIDLDLLSQVTHRGLRHLSRVLREPALISKNFSKATKPTRVAPVLFATSFQPDSSNVQ
jgi:hypothetical protein